MHVENGRTEQSREGQKWLTRLIGVSHFLPLSTVAIHSLGRMIHSCIIRLVHYFWKHVIVAQFVGNPMYLYNMLSDKGGA